MYYLTDEKWKARTVTSFPPKTTLNPSPLSHTHIQSAPCRPYACLESSFGYGDQWAPGRCSSDQTLDPLLLLPPLYSPCGLRRLSTRPWFWHIPGVVWERRVIEHNKVKWKVCKMSFSFWRANSITLKSTLPFDILLTHFVLFCQVKLWHKYKKLY